MSATARALMAFHERSFSAAYEGKVWVPEEVWQKLVELARRELPKGACARHGITECLPCRKEGRR